MNILTEEDKKKLVEKWKPLLDSKNNNGKVKLDFSYVPPSSALPPPRQSPHHKLDKNTPSINISKETTKEEENIEVKLHNTTDAQVWTEDFFKTFGKVYPDIIYYINSLLPKERRGSFKEWVFGWFCNAIQTGIDLTNNERNNQYIYILQSNSGDIVDIYTYEPYEQDINSSYRFHYNIYDETHVDASKKCLLIRYNKHKGMQYWNGKAEPETKYNWKNV